MRNRRGRRASPAGGGRCPRVTPALRRGGTASPLEEAAGRTRRSSGGRRHQLPPRGVDPRRCCCVLGERGGHHSAAVASLSLCPVAVTTRRMGHTCLRGENLEGRRPDGDAARGEQARWWGGCGVRRGSGSSGHSEGPLRSPLVCSEPRIRRPRLENVTAAGKPTPALSLVKSEPAGAVPGAVFSNICYDS